MVVFMSEEAGMRIFMTGGTGLLGRHLCAALAADGHALTVLSRQNAARVRRICGPQVSAISALEAWEPVDFDVVINLAGEPIVDKRWTRARRRALWDSRVTLTEQLVARLAGAAVRPRLLLSGSAIGYYGNTHLATIDESATAATDFASQLCVAWENAARLAEGLGLRVCLLRTGLVLSSRGGLLVRLLPMFRHGIGGRLGDGMQYMSWIHIDDFVNAVRFLLARQDAAGPYNLTAPVPETNSMFTGQLAQVLGKPARMHVPALALRVALGARTPMLLGGQRVLPHRLQDAGYTFSFSSLDDALRDILRHA